MEEEKIIDYAPGIESAVLDNTIETSEEPILKENANRFVLFPIEHDDIALRLHLKNGFKDRHHRCYSTAPGQ